jgi:hypothetical protein
MINIEVFNNGVKIKGHAEQHICSEVSILAWYLANTLSRQGIESAYYSTLVDNPENPAEGLTYLIINPNDKESVWQFNNYKHNMGVWAKDQWPETAVKIIQKDCDLSKEEKGQEP